MKAENFRTSYVNYTLTVNVMYSKKDKIQKYNLFQWRQCMFHYTKYQNVFVCYHHI